MGHQTHTSLLDSPGRCMLGSRLWGGLNQQTTCFGAFATRSVNKPKGSTGGPQSHGYRFRNQLWIGVREVLIEHPSIRSIVKVRISEVKLDVTRLRGTLGCEQGIRHVEVHVRSTSTRVPINTYVLNVVIGKRIINQGLTRQLRYIYQGRCCRRGK